MKGIKYFRLSSVLIFLLCCSPWARANTGKPVLTFKVQYDCIISQSDSLPVTNKNTEQTKADKPTEEVIKEVPKSHKQAVPVPVKVQVTPIRIIKPKIIRPVIKALP